MACVQAVRPKRVRMKYVKQTDGTWLDKAIPALQRTREEKDEVMREMYRRCDATFNHIA